MARLKLTIPYIGHGTYYYKYRDWLSENFYENCCSYCLRRFPDNPNIDHYEPREYAPNRITDPNNLLFSCSNCGGRSCKSDYHPLHSTRRQLSKDTTGYYIHDIRSEDFAKLYTINTNGELRAKKGKHEARANWNISILKLHLKGHSSYRNELLCELKALSALDALIAIETNINNKKNYRDVYNEKLNLLAKNLIFYHALNIPIPKKIRNNLKAYKLARSIR